MTTRERVNKINLNGVIKKQKEKKTEKLPRGMKIGWSNYNYRDFRS